MIDIVPELLEKIESEFKNKTNESKIVKRKLEALIKNKASFEDANEFAIEVGEILADVFKTNITAEILPNGKMYFNIADRVIRPGMENNYKIISNYAVKVQDISNKKAGINIASQKPEINNERIDNLVDKICEYEDFEKGKFLIDEPIVNFSQAVVDDSINANADFLSKAGFQEKIIRKQAGNCCKWCANLVGTYNYPDEVPKDVWRRHRFCKCTLDHVTEKGSKKVNNDWNEEKHKRNKRKEFSEKEKTFVIKDSQFGKKANTHMKDYGLDISNRVDRNKFKDIINDIVNNHDEVIRGISWRSQAGYLTGYLKGEDVVLVNKDNVFVTILKGGVNNARIKNARK